MLGALIVVPLWYFQPKIIGTRPEKNFDPNAHATQFQYNDPDLERLRTAARSNPESKQHWMALAKGLVQKSQEGIISREEALRDTLEAVSKALELDPEDSETVYLAAEVNFEAQRFGAAKGLYERYLAFHPEDTEVMTRYASALTFAGEPERAVQILDQALQADPHSFQARAILAISYAELGEAERALEVGEDALALAPTDEARARFQQFLAQLDGSAAVQPTARELNPEAIELAQFIKENPVAGPKITDFQVEGESLSIITRDFPMGAMPPFAKEKFFSGIREFAKERGLESIQTVRFIEEGEPEPQAVLDLK